MKLQLGLLLVVVGISRSVYGGDDTGTFRFSFRKEGTAIDFFVDRDEYIVNYGDVKKDLKEQIESYGAPLDKIVIADIAIDYLGKGKNDSDLYEGYDTGELRYCEAIVQEQR